MSVSHSRRALLAPFSLAMLIVSEGFSIAQGFMRECFKVVWILARRINKAELLSRISFYVEMMTRVENSQ